MYTGRERERDREAEKSLTKKNRAQPFASSRKSREIRAVERKPISSVQRTAEFPTAHGAAALATLNYITSTFRPRLLGELTNSRMLRTCLRSREEYNAIIV